jgi:hypothetical protein
MIFFFIIFFAIFSVCLMIVNKEMFIFSLHFLIRAINKILKTNLNVYFFFFTKMNQVLEKLQKALKYFSVSKLAFIIFNLFDKQYMEIPKDIKDLMYVQKKDLILLF